MRTEEKLYTHRRIIMCLSCTEVRYTASFRAYFFLGGHEAAQAIQAFSVIG